MIVRLTGWKVGLMKISLTKLIQRESGYSISKAKQCTDDLLIGKIVELLLPDEDCYKRFIEEATKIGAITEGGSK